MLGSKEVLIQGIFPVKSGNRILIAGQQAFTTAPYGTPEIENKVFNLTKQKFDEFLRAKIASVGMWQLFEYTGTNWVGKRR